MSTLEKALKDLEMKHGLPKKDLTLSERGLRYCQDMARKSRFEAEEVEREARFKVSALKKKGEKFAKAFEILNGAKGYFSCYQELAEREMIIDKFTRFEDCISLFEQTMVGIHTEKPRASLGLMIFEVNENGFLELIEHKVDSSD